MLILRASANERRDEVDMRLRVLGNSEDAAATALSLEQDRQLRNPALRWLCHLVWRTGVELQPEVVLRIVIVIALIIPLASSEERRVGKEGVSTVRSRGAPDHLKKKKK